MLMEKLVAAVSDSVFSPLLDRKCGQANTPSLPPRFGVLDLSFLSPPPSETLKVSPAAYLPHGQGASAFTELFVGSLRLLCSATPNCGRSAVPHPRDIPSRPRQPHTCLALIP